MKAAESSEVSRSRHPFKTRGSKRTAFVAGFILLFSLIAGAALWALLRPTGRAPVASAGEFSVAVQRTATFALYYPRVLPEGWQVNASSMSASAELVTFSVTDRTGTRLVVTQQMTPPIEQLDAFYKEQILEPATVTTAIGRAVIGSFEGGSIGAVTAGNTWIVVRALGGVQEEAFRQLVQGFRVSSRN